MAENVGIQFYKGWYGKGAEVKNKLPNVDGAIIFNEEEQIIYVNGKPYGGASSVSFADNVLTITYSDGRATQTLDFNDTASATATLKVFKRINNLIGPNINAINGDDDTLNYTGTNYLTGETTLVGADRALDTAIKAVDTRIDNMDVESNSVGEGNVHVTYKQEDGEVTVESVTEDYATLTNTRYKKAEGETPAVAPTLGITTGDEGKLLKASDTTTIKNYVDDRVNQLGDGTKKAFDNLKAEDVATTGIGAHTTGEGEEATTTYDIAAGDVQGVLETLNTKINNLNASSTLTLKKVSDGVETDAKTVTADGTEYKLYQGTNVVANFNIEKDSFVKEGKVVRGSLNDGVFTKDDNGEYFIHLVINTRDATTGTTAEDNVYIPAESLVDAYTANNKHTEGEGDEATEVDNNVTITVDNTNNTISAVIKAAGVGTNELADGAVTFAKIATANVQDGDKSKSTLLTTKTYVDESIAGVVDGLDADFTGDNAKSDEEGNVTVSLKEEDGIVTTLGVDVTYATIASSKDGENDTTLTGTDGTGILIGTDVATLVNFTNTRITEEVAKLDATVASETVAEGGSQTSTVLTTIIEENGKLKSVSNSVLGATVSYTAATETKEANLTATNTTGAVLGSDITAIKSYIDAKSAKSTTTVTANVDDSLFVTESTGTDGHTNYDVKLVWIEWSDNTSNSPADGSQEA